MNLGKQFLVFLFLTSCFSLMQSVDAEECSINADDSRTIEYLRTLTIEELTDIKVVLDDVFDVFDGLIKTRKTTIATGVEQSTGHAPSATTVITAQDIEAMGAQDLDEVLETVPGLHVAFFPARYDPIYVIRGIYSDFNPQVLLLINDIPWKGLLTGHRTVVGDGIPINAIKRIEIIRGPGSAVYGADAWAGVINIITKNKQDLPETEFGMRSGSFNTKEIWALHGGHYAGFDASITLEHRDTEGHQEIIEADAQTALDKIYGTQVSLAPGAVNLSRRGTDIRLDVSRNAWQWRVGLRDRDRVGTGAGNSRALDPIGLYAEQQVSSDLSYHHTDFQDWDMTVLLNYLSTGWDVERDIYTYPPGAFAGQYPKGHFSKEVESAERQFGLSLSAFYSGITHHLLRFGAGYSYGKLHDVRTVRNFGIDFETNLPVPTGSDPVLVKPFVREGVRKDNYLFLQDSWKLTTDWDLTAGIRYDDYSDFGSTINPRLALVWQTHPKLTSKLLYGRAFRAPAFFELYATNSPVAQGNPLVEPETLESLELAFNYCITPYLHVESNFFTYKTADTIRYVRASPETVPLAQNVGSQKSFGFEGELRWKMTSKSSLLANYAFVKVTDEFQHDTGNYPRHSGHFRADYLVYPDWYLDVSANWVADRRRVFKDPRPPISDYAIANLTLRYKDVRQGRSNFAFSVRNLFDTDAREPSPGPDASGVISIPYDLPLARRSYFLEWRYQF